jgi:hypothetical protein
VATEQDAVGRYVRPQIEIDRMAYHGGQIRVQQRLTTVEPNVPHAERFRIIEQGSHDVPTELAARHEVAAVAATDAAQVAVGRDRDLEMTRLGPDDDRQQVARAVTSALDLDIGPDQPFPERRMSAKRRSEDAAQ